MAWHSKEVSRMVLCFFYSLNNSSHTLDSNLESIRFNAGFSVWFVKSVLKRSLSL